MPEIKATKLKIEAFERPDFDLDKAKSSLFFEVMFNPEKYSRKYQAEYEKKRPKKGTASSHKFKGVKPQDFELEFVLDGTGASVEGSVDVESSINDLINLAGRPVGKTHRPYYLKVFWGTILVRCVLLSVDANYTLFAPDGTALRATVRCKFSEVKSDGRRVADDRNNSPDLTHKRLVKRDDRLDNYSSDIYQKPDYYLQVARFNGLKNFRRLRIGTELSFPPLKNESQI